MGVDYYGCKCCGESRYSEYVGHCSECQNRLCTQCVINDDVESSYACDYGVKFDGSQEQKEEYGVKSKEEDKYGYEIGEMIDDVGMDSKYCPFCNGEKIDNDDLFRFIIKKYQLDIESEKKDFLVSK